ncbi:alpha/beta hydrolase family protein [Maritalea porphyrae]|uniref:alpha/beta hydrolase family protein n=1 Tax=Maritalea porphyrae TaxID=880732 RepID=UPI0022B07CED|nr:alpha/beta hydrolase [Maritalea porphyrae]MCZ4273852.1 alpha/beta hydrolase [Maritalea porphyrae]
MRFKHISIGAGAILGVVLLMLTFLFLLPDQRYSENDFRFDFRGTEIAGKLILPLVPTNGPIDCLVFVHGDGAMSFDGTGYFEPYFSHFAQKGMCALSWHKPGVDGAEGEWLDYSMADRAALVEAGVAALRSNSVQPIGRVGLIGFSQAGWVLPKIEPIKNDIAFYVFVSPAVNWMEQSAYMTNLRNKNTTPDLVKVRNNQAIDEMVLAGAPYRQFEQYAAKHKEIDKEEFSPKRWTFITKNARSDLSQDIGQLNDVPVLLLTGARDGQLDAAKTDATFKKLLGEKLVRHQFETAGHSMIQVDQRKPMDGFDGFWVLLKVGFMGRDAFVEGYWAAMDEFIAAVLN